jgi:hypothetical protein
MQTPTTSTHIEVSDVTIQYPVLLASTEQRLPDTQVQQISIKGQDAFLDTYRAYVESSRNIDPNTYILTWSLESGEKGIEVTYQDLRKVFFDGCKAEAEATGNNISCDYAYETLDVYFNNLQASLDSIIDIKASSPTAKEQQPDTYYYDSSDCSCGACVAPRKCSFPTCKAAKDYCRAHHGDYGH